MTLSSESLKTIGRIHYIFNFTIVSGPTIDSLVVVTVLENQRRQHEKSLDSHCPYGVGICF